MEIINHSLVRQIVLLLCIINFSCELPQSHVEKSTPKLCSVSKIDAALYDNHRRLTIIAGRYSYYTNGSAVLIAHKWPGAPDSIDAAFKLHPDIYLFSGSKVWAFHPNDTLKANYPKPICKDFSGIPSGLDAIMKVNNSIYAFRDTLYWRFDATNGTVNGTVKHTGDIEWFHLPGPVDAGFYCGRNKVQVFYSGRYAYSYKDKQVVRNEIPFLKC